MVAAFPKQVMLMRGSANGALLFVPFVLLICCVVHTRMVHAAMPAVTVQAVEDLRARLNDAESLSESVAAELLAELGLVERRLAELERRRYDVINAEQEAASVVELTAALKSEIWRLSAAPVAELVGPSDRVSLQSSTTELERSVLQTRQALFDALGHDAQLRSRATAIGDEMAAVAAGANPSDSSARGNVLSMPQRSGDSELPLAIQIQTLSSISRTHAVTESIGLLQRELSTLAPRQTLASLQIRVLQLRLARDSTELDRQWRQLNQIRIEQARLQLAQPGDESRSTGTAAESSPDIAVPGNSQWSIAEVSLLEQELPLQQSTAQTADSILEIYEIRQVLTQINSTGTGNDLLAEMVRTLRNQLPDKAMLGSRLRNVQDTQRRLQVNRILWESALRGSGGDVLGDVLGDATGDSLTALVSLLSVANRVADRLVTLEAMLAEAQNRSDKVGAMLDGSVLWLRTNESAGVGWLKNVYTGLQWIANPQSWRGTGAALVHGLQARVISSLLLVLALLLLMSTRMRVNTMLGNSAMGVGNVGEDRYWATPLALGASLLWALPVPLFFGVFYWILNGAFLIPGTLLAALSDSLLATATILFVLLFFQALCRPEGVLLRHFEWNAHAVNRLYRHLRWFIWISALCTAVFTLTLLGGLPELRYGLGVSAFMAVSVAMSALLHVCLRPNRGVAFEVMGSQAQSLFTRLAIWCLIAIPVVVGVLPLLGYFDTAVQIQSRAFRTGVYLMVTVVLIGLVTRVFMVAHRRMSLRKVRAKRASREAERTAQQNAPVSGDATPDLSFAWDDDHKRIANQAQQLFRLAGLVLFLFTAWMVWKPLFPVLDIFNDIVLWQAAQTPGGPTGGQSVTLGRLLFALGVVILGFIGSRNLRALLEITLFERMKIDTGVRYAINAIASYTLLGAALLIGIAQLGVDWSRLQWIVAALGVGLGFGLQEIVANFISGLIILFERPVRVGDTVTIGGLSGTVSNIQIRATTLTDFDNREVLLPNKSIITENVTNWTLHNAVTRILLSVGVAYGSDIEQVRTLLLKCVESAEDVLTSPEPTVFFMRHGDSSLEYEIRAFVATPAHRLPVMHALNTSINQTLAAHGIEIPFPQRVVTLRNDEQKSAV